MLRSRIIPCLLLRGGGLVKTRKFTDPKYLGDPLNIVKIFNEKQVDELMFLDIEATMKRSEPNLQLLKRLAVESRMPLCYGGGIATASQAEHIIGLGFEKISVSSAALLRPDLIRELSQSIGSQSVVVTLDVRRVGRSPTYSVYLRNGLEKQGVDFVEFCQHAVAAGAGELVINSIDRDGEMKGYDLELAKLVRSVVSCPLSFVGGAGCVEDMQQLIDEIGVVGAAAGSMFVFKGQYRAVLVSYARPERLN